MLRIWDRPKAQGDAAAGPDGSAAASVVAPTVTVYADDCVLAGELVPTSTDPSDRLAEWMPLALRDIVGIAIADGAMLTLADVSVGPDEIVAVSMPEVPPEYGSIRRSRVTLSAGPYFIEGTISALPSSDPIASLRRRARIELTGAAIEYRVAGRPRRDLVPGLSVNRYQVELMAEADEIDPQDG